MATTTIFNLSTQDISQALSLLNGERFLELMEIRFANNGLKFFACGYLPSFEAITPRYLSHEYIIYTRNGKRIGIVSCYTTGFQQYVPENGRISERLIFCKAEVDYIEVQKSHGVSINTMAEIKQLLLLGKKIDAIKLYRYVTGLGLKDSKEEVEKIMYEMM